MHRTLIPLCAVLATCMTGWSAEPAMPAYRWEAKKIYRYQFSRKSEVTEVDAQQPGNGRVTDCRFILVIEVDSVDKDGTATGDLRFMTPQITLPPFLQLSDSEQEETVVAGSNRRNARAMEDILASTKWRVTIASNGTIRMPDRQPENWRTWLERSEQVAAWPKRLHTRLAELLDTHFRLGTEDADDEWLPVFSAQPPGNRGTGLHAFRPRRLTRVGKTAADGRIHLRLQREAAEDPQPVDVPLIEAQIPAVTVSRGEVKTLAGEAVFDPKIGLLDSATERFRVKLTSRCGKMEQQAAAWVSYEVRRLAPPLRGEATEEEGGKTQ